MDKEKKSYGAAEATAIENPIKNSQFTTLDQQIEQTEYQLDSTEGMLFAIEKKLLDYVGSDIPPTKEKTSGCETKLIRNSQNIERLMGVNGRLERILGILIDHL